MPKRSLNGEEMGHEIIAVARSRDQSLCGRPHAGRLREASQSNTDDEQQVAYGLRREDVVPCAAGRLQCLLEERDGSIDLPPRFEPAVAWRASASTGAYPSSRALFTTPRIMPSAC